MPQLTQPQTREVLELLWQYSSDLRYPPTGDSLQRRLERVDAMVSKIEGKA